MRGLHLKFKDYTGNELFDNHDRPVYNINDYKIELHFDEVTNEFYFAERASLRSVWSDDLPEEWKEDKASIGSTQQNNIEILLSMT